MLMIWVYVPVCFMFVYLFVYCVSVCLCVFLALCLPDNVPASLFLCHCVSSLIAGPSGEINTRNKITKLSNCFIDWLSLFSVSFASSLIPHSFCPPRLHSLSLFASLQLFHLLSFFFPFPFLFPPLPFITSTPTQQADRRVHRRSLIVEGLPANVFRCHGDATENGTARTERMRSSALQVSLW